MKVLLITAIWICWILVVVPTLVRPLIIGELEAPTYDTITLDLQNVDSYSSFLTSLRNKVKAAVQACQLPVTQKTVAVAKRFVLVDLKVSTTMIITLGIDVTNVYVVGYRDKYNGKDRANFLKSIPKEATDNLFIGATNEKPLPFTGEYKDLEKAAKKGRGDIVLGFEKLKFGIQSVFGKARSKSGDIEAKFVIIAIQMVSEAARFKYIENQVIESGDFQPDAKFLDLENSWDSISKAIHKSAGEKPPCVNISPSLQLQNPDYTTWTVSKVSEISPDMGLLKYKGDKLGIEAITAEAANQW